jgi:ribosome-binding factor A
MSRRTERVAELIRQTVSRMIVSELVDPRIGFVTVTRVEVSPDMTLAKVFVSVMETPEKVRTTLRGLNSAIKRIRLAIGEDVGLRRTPEIVFHIDTGLARAQHISGLLADLARERREREEDTEGSEKDAEEEDGDDR